MAYVPPSKRKQLRNEDRQPQSQSERNIFTKKMSKQESNEVSPNIDEEESFPTLGNTIETTTNNTMDYASSLFKPQPKKEIKKPIKDGWVHIYANKTPKFVYGEKSKEMIEFESWMEDVEISRQVDVLLKILDRHEEYKEIDLFLNGPEYLYSWEIQDYLDDLAWEKKRNEDHSSSEESSDDDNEFN